ncbi:transaldolase [Candidatus Pelagibacter sp. HIMB1746]|uniref:transaldolase n=1 Tax=Candidatus Pelagibacter sp. HIMB1746 TaxID=3413370 RepID=UPI003F834357
MHKLKIKIFADGADEKHMLDLNKLKHIKGLTTNPSLMKKAGIKNYSVFAKKILKKIKIKPISFEVFSDKHEEMYKQAKIISSWGKNVYVKIPITNSKGKSCHKIIKKLSDEKVNLNITAVFTISQVKILKNNLNPKSKSIISIFAGRIADTGRNPADIIKQSVKMFSKHKNVEILWASTRELFNIFEANNLKCQIITVTPDILKKIKLINYNLNKYSLDTIKDFYNDAKAVGYKI